MRSACGIALFCAKVFFIVIFSSICFFSGSVMAANALTERISVNGDVVQKQIAKQFILVAENKKFSVSAKELKTWVRLKNEGGTTLMWLIPGKIYDYLNVYVSPQVNNPGENAKFVMQGNAFLMSKPGSEGNIIDGIKTSLAIRSALASGKGSAKIYFKKYLPPVTTDKAFKKTGIKSVLSTGTTSFAGSPKNRIKNIEVGRAKLQGQLVPPGEEFSLNKSLGPITEAAGFLPELVIKENITKPEYGGGLCQISTTLFRAAVNAGLNIVERHNHAYPVKYYGVPGFDATIYSPRPDLRFLNNTGSWLMIQSSISGSKLTFQIFGVSDRRNVKIDGPHVIEKKPDGSIRTLLREVVTDKNGGEILNKLFPSEYKSPDLFPVTRKENGEGGKLKP
jgi:vancomycin resistance protein YoaR